MSGTTTSAGGPLLVEVVRPLSVEDLTILGLETEVVAGHTCKVIMLGDGIDADLLRASIASRLDQALPLRLCLCETQGEPCWALEPNLDLDHHVVVYDEAGPLDMAGLRSAVARIFEQRLDRARPLWRIDIVPSLAGGGSALVWRIHHALADGTTAMRVAAAALWDPAPGSPAPHTVATTAAAAKKHAGLVARHHFDGLRAAAREAPHPWRRSPFNGHIDATRTVAFTSLELEGLRTAARATDGATLNDAVLAVVAGGLRRWLEERHGHIGAVRIKVPVSLHGVAAPGDDGAAAGNRDSFFCLDVPLAADPVDRLRAIRHATRVRKEGHDAQQLDALMRRLGDAPQLRSFAQRVLTHPRSFALNVSNVPGPRQPVHVLGVPVRALYSIAEIREHHALRIAVVSLCDTLNFGLTADPTLVPDVDLLADHMQADVTTMLARLEYA
jgi:diacylglycerol O-acyltransferase / wax synthase